MEKILLHLLSNVIFKISEKTMLKENENKKKILSVFALNTNDDEKVKPIIPSNKNN